MLDDDGVSSQGRMSVDTGDISHHPERALGWEPRMSSDLAAGKKCRSEPGLRDQNDSLPVPLLQGTSC